jgi:hypothetical protein
MRIVRTAAACGFRARTRKGQLVDADGESSVGNDASHLSPVSGRELAPAAHLPAESFGGKRLGCCGIAGPGPSATLDTTSRRLSGKTESMYFDLMIHVKRATGSA